MISNPLLKFEDHKKILAFLLMLVIRCLIIILTWYIARTSFVYLIRFDQNIHTNLIIDLLLFILRALVALVLEITITTQLLHSSPDDRLLHNASWNRLFQANICLVTAELSMFLALLLELENLHNINFVLSIITTASFLWVLLNPTGYIVQWIILISYGLGIIILMFPRNEDPNLKNLDTAAIVLFLRSIFLPI